MTAKDLIKYLEMFPETQNASFVVVNPQSDKRNVYPVLALNPIKDNDIENPAFIITVGEARSMDSPDELTIRQKVEFISEHYGYDAQSRQCIEEMAELTQAINKFWRGYLKCGKYEFSDTADKIMSCKEYDNLVEEIADVQITLYYLKHFLKCDIKNIMNAKLDRQIRRIKGEAK